MKHLAYIRWFVPAVLIGWVAWQALIASGSLEAVTDFRERTPFFDVLLPAGRVVRTGEGIVLKQEPVYIDVRLPVRAKSIALELKVTDSSSPIKVGWQAADNFNLVFSEAKPINDRGLTLYHYELNDINYVRPGHKTRFVISSPGLVPGSVIVTGASISIKRERPSLAWWHQYLTDLWQK